MSSSKNVKREDDLETGKRTKSKYKKIVIDRDECIGAASCIAVAPGTFQLDDENLAYLVDPDVYDDETLLLAAQSCPTNAISVYDEKGNKIWPLDK
jgi:ferredoxin